MHQNQKMLAGATRKRASTLIELLVVIAIIALLAAILFPVFSRVRENARRSSCSSNLKQLMLGITQYSQDYDERLPGVGTNGSTTTGSWRSRIAAYVKSETVFACPSAGYTPTVVSNTARQQKGYDGLPNAYAGNGGSDSGFSASGSCVFSSSNPYKGCIPMAIRTDVSYGRVLSELVIPTETVLLYEAGARGGVSPGWNNVDFNVWAGHLGMMNVAFADGHVKSMKPSATATPKNMWTIDDDGPMAVTMDAWKGTGSSCDQTKTIADGCGGLLQQDDRYN